ncbi:MAG: MFS transporter [Actinobacteria bacterium]|nr:MFS transporter [Actinomycetota bacterium]
MTIKAGTLARLTGAKAVANTALRWIPPFLPTLEKAFGVSTTQLTTIIGASEFAGLSTIAVGKHLDHGRERLVMVSALGLVSASSIIALGGSITTFAIAFVVLILGVSNFTVAGHAWISHRVDYRWRARSIGLFETSWAFALLIGAPIIALLITVFGWRGPFVALAIASAVSAVVVATTLPVTRQTAATESDEIGDISERDVRVPRQPLTKRAWLVVFGSALMATAGLSVFVISGTWLHDAFGVSTAGIGFAAMAFGGIELLASTSTAAFADRLGKLRSTIAGLMTLVVGLAIMLSSNGHLAVGMVGLLIFLLGFEYGFVTSLSLTSEAMPEARGTTLALSNAIGTVARGAGAILSGWLYGLHGIAGTASLSVCAAAVSLTCFVLSRRIR